jgi:hypothetical protein
MTVNIRQISVSAKFRQFIPMARSFHALTREISPPRAARNISEALASNEK